MKEQLFQFQPLTEQDLPLLCNWLNRPHLQEWWREGEITIDSVREKYIPRIIESDSAKPFLAYIVEKPVGYIQYYQASNGDPNWWPDEPGHGVLGIDQFLADEETLGQGVGTSMISQFIKKLMEDPNVTEIRVDPRPDNLRAIRCYKKVGFCEIGPITTPDGPALLMVLERNAL